MCSIFLVKTKCSMTAQPYNRFAFCHGRGICRLMETRPYWYTSQPSLLFSTEGKVRAFQVSACNSLFIQYISEVIPFSLVREYTDIKINKHEIW